MSPFLLPFYMSDWRDRHTYHKTTAGSNTRKSPETIQKCQTKKRHATVKAASTVCKWIASSIRCEQQCTNVGPMSQTLPQRSPTIGWWSLFFRLGIDLLSQINMAATMVSVLRLARHESPPGTYRLSFPFFHSPLFCLTSYRSICAEVLTQLSSTSQTLSWGWVNTSFRWALFLFQCTTFQSSYQKPIIFYHSTLNWFLALMLSIVN